MEQNKQTNIRLPIAYRNAMRTIAARCSQREHRKVTSSEVVRAALYAYFVSPAVLADMQATPAIFKKAKAEARAERKAEENNGK